MSGFTIYETLRIFLPGALGILFADLTVRLATGPEVFAPGRGVAEAVVESLESAGTFAGLAVLLGLLLYLVDMPARTRLIEGDVARGYARPSDTLAAMLAGTALERDSLSLYFILSDKYLPEELHKRIYLFGSLYRVFVDLRVLAMTALVSGSLLAAVAARRDAARVTLEIGWEAVLATSVVALLVAAVALFGVREHAVRRARSPRTSTRGAWLVGPGLLILALAGAAAAQAIAMPSPWAYAALVPGGAALAVWWAVEIGPARPGEQTFRAALLGLLGLQSAVAPQFSVAQRTLTELALVVPAVVAASAAAALQGRPPASVLAWALLAVPAAAIMSIRKHETRLLGAYRQQSTWLCLQKAKIADIVTNGLPDSWE